MFIADIITGNTISKIHSNIFPFVYKIYPSYFIIKSEWGSSCDDIFDLGYTENIQQITCNYTNRLNEMSTLEDLYISQNSYFIDKTNQIIYIHTSLEYSPVFRIYDYGIIFGVCTRGVNYINETEYLPYVSSFPEIEIEDDATGQKQPTGIVANITLFNEETENLLGRKEGVLDFMLKDTASCYGNDVYMYDYNTTTQEKTLIGVSSIKNISTTLQKVTLSLKDERMGES